MNRSDMYFLMYIVLAFAAMAIANKLGAEGVGVALFFGIMFGGLFGQDIIFREITGGYQYVRALIRPGNVWAHLYVKQNGIHSKKTYRDAYSTVLDLAFPIRMRDPEGIVPDFGKITQVIINHNDEWNERVRFKPGRAVYAGVIIKHPSVEYMELYPSHTGTSEVDHAQNIPVFWLASAGQDYYKDITVREEEDPQDKTIVRVRVKQLERFKCQLVEALRSRAEAHRRMIALEQRITQVLSEDKALIEMKIDVKHYAWQLCLTTQQACATIDEAVRRLGGSKWPQLGKYAYIAIVAIAFIVYLALNPEQADQLFKGIGSPIGLLFLVFGVGLVYLLVRRR